MSSFVNPSLIGAYFEKMSSNLRDVIRSIPPCMHHDSLLRYESPLVIKCAGVTAMLCLVYVVQVHAEERVRKQAAGGRVGEVGVYDDHRQNTEKQVETKVAESAEGILRPDYLVTVRVKVFTVLLKHCLTSVFLGPTIHLRSVRLID